MCKIERRGGRMFGVVPFLTSFVDRKYLLLGVHVQQQVSNTVAVAELIIIPGEGGKNPNEVFACVKVKLCSSF